MVAPDQEYIAVHSSTIEAICDATKEQTSQRADAYQVMSDGSSLTSYVLRGGFTLEDIHALYGELPKADEQELIDVRNKALLHEAQINILNLLAVASVHHYVDLYQTVKAEQVAAEDPRVLSYQEGVFISTKQPLVTEGKDVRLYVTHLRELESWNSAQEFKVDTIDVDGFQRHLRICRLGSAIVAVNLTTDMEKDPLFTRCQEVFSTTIAVFPYLSGRFGTEEELDEALSELWQSYQGTSKEQEVGPLIDELRDRATAMKAAQRLDVTHKSYLPSADQLEEFLTLIG